MANDFYTADQVAQVAVAMAADDLALLSTVTRVLDGIWRPGGGATAYLKVPSAAIARDKSIADKSTSIVMDELTEDAVPVALDTHAYHGVTLSEADLNLNLTDFSRQVLRPQVQAVVDKCEHEVATVLAGVAENASIAWSASDPLPTFTAMRRALRTQGVDTSADEPMFAVCGGNVIDALLDSGSLDADKTGSADALRNGSVGRLRGFTVLESGRVGADEIVAYPKHGVYLAIMAPEVPRGASFGQSVSEKGLSLRYLRDYDAQALADRSIVSTFVKAGQMPAYEITRDYTGGAESVTVSEVAEGHVVKVDTST